jgi:1-acyl-sn-glycerol-3-phosphate acyltransferase
MLYLRSGIFYFFLIIGLGLIFIGVPFLYFTPLIMRQKIILSWVWLVRFSLKYICNVEIKFKGFKNYLDSKFLFVSNHQSTLETLVLHHEFQPISAITKKENLSVPVFGLGFRLLEPIYIERDMKLSSTKKIIREGIKKIEAGLSVLYFPEGTRMPAGKIGRFSRTGIEVAAKTETSIIPIVHNSAECWPPSYLIQPGKVIFYLGDPIEGQL